MWDYRLLKAHYILQDWYRDGIPIWWDESERVAFEVEGRVSKSRAAIERAQEKASKGNANNYGRYYIARAVPIGGGSLPDRNEWIEEQAKKSGKTKTVSKFGGNDKQQIVQGRK